MPNTLCPDARECAPLGAPQPPGAENRIERAAVFLIAPAVALGYFVIVAVLRCVCSHSE